MSGERKTFSPPREKETFRRSMTKRGKKGETGLKKKKKRKTEGGDGGGESIEPPPLKKGGSYSSLALKKGCSVCAQGGKGG